MNNIKKIRLQLTLLILVLIIGVFVVHYNITQRTTNEYLMENTKKYQVAFKSTYSQFKQMSDLTQSGLKTIGNLSVVMKQALALENAEQHPLREKLYKKIMTRYKALKVRHIKSINFILADNRMLLKMNNFKQFGERVSANRYLVHSVHQNKKPVSGYELGLYGEGFKFIYPVFDGDTYLGMVSLTYGIEAFTEMIMKQYTVLSKFYIKEKNFNKELLVKKPKLYKLSPNKKFIINMKIQKVLDKIENTHELQQEPPEDVKKHIAYELNNIKEAKSIYLNKMGVVFTFIPIHHSISNDMEGILVIKSQNDAIDIIMENYYLTSIILFVLIILAIAIVYLYITRLIKEREEITQKLHLEKQLKEQSKQAAMGEMIGNIAHQWRQPLSVISTASTGIIFQEDLGLLKKEHLIKEMNNINNNVQYLSRTIDDFRDFIKGERKLQKFNLSENINSFLNLVHGNIKANDISLNLNLDDKIVLKSYPNELIQCFINIFNNSKDAMKDMEDDKEFFIDTLDTGDSIKIIFKDNAKGIPDDILPKIFEPYFTTKHKSQGTGLGLHMAYSLITEGMQGQISAMNVKYKHNKKEHTGAQFTIELPKTQD